MDRKGGKRKKEGKKGGYNGRTREADKGGKRRRNWKTEKRKGQKKE
jgi:hypothetical protein